MKYSDLYTPIEAFAAFIMKNISTIVDYCGYAGFKDFNCLYSKSKLGEDLCIMTLSSEESSMMLVCQLYNVDDSGVPASSLRFIKDKQKDGNKGRFVVVCPGLYPQVIDNIKSFGFKDMSLIAFLVVNGCQCEYLSSEAFLKLPTGQNQVKKDEEI